jgi:FkbM family methyltransferase
MAAMRKRMAWVIRRAVRRLGYDIVWFHPSNLIQLLSRLQIDCLVDVGANEGQFASRVLAEGWRGPILSFEPGSEAHAKLTQRANAGAPKWKVAPQMALGDRSGQTTLRVSNHSESSSLLPLGDLMRNELGLSLVREEAVRLARLDEIADTLISGAQRLFVKADTQGSEAQIVRGATGVFDRIVGFQLEMSIEPLYEGEPDMTSLIAIMRDYGYQLWNIAPAYHRPSNGQLLQVDGIFVRRDAT